MKKMITVILSLLMVVMMLAAACAETTVFTYTSDRDTQVPATLVVPDGAASYPLVVLAHGHGGSREENVGFAAIAKALEEKGIASIRMDFPGCGESTESFQLNRLYNMEMDVLSAVSYAAENLPVTSLGLFGYSMGGRIALELTANGINPDAIVLLAPAADNADMKNLFGGEEAWAAMNEIAEKEGFAPYDTIYGQHQELSAGWFADFLLFDDVKTAAAAVFNGPAMVIFGDDDEAVSPAVSAAVAETLNAEVVKATGEGHGYGFYSEDDTVRSLVASSTADFFAANLK